MFEDMTEKNIVCGDSEIEIPMNVSFAKYVVDNLRAICADGDKVAMINGKSHEQTSYRQLLRNIVDIGHGLKRVGLEPGDTVALCSENSSYYISATIAAIAVGATVTMINVKYTNDEIVHALNISKPRLIFSSQAALETKLRTFRQASCIEHIVQLNGEVTAEDVTPLSDLEVPESSMDDYEPLEVRDASDTAFLFYSSGTTGYPKGVMLTHLNVVYGSKIFNYASKNYGNVLTILPLYHVYGFFTTIQYIVSGNSVVFLAELHLDTYLATIEKYQIAEMLAVPPIVVILAKSPLVHKYDLSSVKVIWCSAAPISADTIISAKKNLPNCKGIFQSYGLTETALSVLKEQENSEGSIGIGSCGGPLPGITVKILDIITREKVGPHQHGEICIKGPMVMKGYVNNEAATRETFDGEGFLKTGDVGYYDDEGCFYIIDRCKDIIKYKGQQVAPAVVESVIMQHEDVAECGVVGAPDELAGELPTAFVVKKPGSGLTDRQLLDFTAARLSPVSRLRGGVIFVEEIPRNGSGKILRRELRNQLLEIEGQK